MPFGKEYPDHTIQVGLHLNGNPVNRNSNAGTNIKYILSVFLVSIGKNTYMVLLTIMYYSRPLIVASNTGEKSNYHSMAAGYF